MSPPSAPRKHIIDVTDSHPERNIMDTFTRSELQAIYLTDEGILSLCDMLAAIPAQDWPEDDEDLHWLLWSFGAAPISSESV